MGVKGNQVRVGIHARKEMPVHRGEIYERIKQETQPARVVRRPRLSVTPAQSQL